MNFSSGPPSGEVRLKTSPILKPLRWLVGLVATIDVTRYNRKSTKGNQGKTERGVSGCQPPTAKEVHDDTGVGPKAYCHGGVPTSNRFGIGVVA